MDATLGRGNNMKKALEAREHLKSLRTVHSGWRGREGPGQARMREVGFSSGQL